MENLGWDLTTAGGPAVVASTFVMWGFKKLVRKNFPELADWFKKNPQSLESASRLVSILVGAAIAYFSGNPMAMASILAPEVRDIFHRLPLKDLLRMVLKNQIR